MIDRIRLIRNIGQFDSVSAGANIPLARLTVVYAENGRGKTTLAAVLRSLATGETTVVFRDSAFADDVAKTNLTAILAQNSLANVRSL
jgi:wobble nucleotide-excising tRNase